MLKESGILKLIADRWNSVYVYFYDLEIFGCCYYQNHTELDWYPLWFIFPAFTQVFLVKYFILCFLLKENIVQLLKNACVVPSYLRDACKDVIKNSQNKLIEGIIHGGTSKSICVKLGYCKWNTHLYRYYIQYNASATQWMFQPLDFDYKSPVYMMSCSCNKEAVKLFLKWCDIIQLIFLNRLKR